MDWKGVLRESWKYLVAIIVIQLFIIVLMLIVHTSTGPSTKCSKCSNQARSAEPKLKLWPNARVPYTIAPELDTRTQQLIRKAIKGIEYKTCIRFVDALSSADRNWLNFVRDDSECVYPKTVGMSDTERKGQDIVISADCLSSGQIQRYIGLALGLGFEETRPDRDSYIRYKSDLPECLAGLSNLPNISKLHHPAALSIFFDYYSHMFVETKCFRPIGPTQIRKSSLQGTRLGSNQSDPLNLGSSDVEYGGTFSVLDIEKINAIYNCSGCYSYRFRPVNEVIEQAESFESFNPVLAGVEYNTINGESFPLHICRVYHHGSLLTGKLYAENQHVPICWTSDANPTDYSSIFVFYKNFEVLLNPENVDLSWYRVDGSNNLPNNTIVGGNTSTRRQFYVGRCTVDTFGQKAVVPGFLFPGATTMSVATPFFNANRYCSPVVEVLVCQDQDWF